MNRLFSKIFFQKPPKPKLNETNQTTVDSNDTTQVTKNPAFDQSSMKVTSNPMVDVTENVTVKGTVKTPPRPHTHTSQNNIATPQRLPTPQKTPLRASPITTPVFIPKAASPLPKKPVHISQGNIATPQRLPTPQKTPLRASPITTPKNKSTTPKVLQSPLVASKLSRNRAKLIAARLAAGATAQSPKRNSPLPKTPGQKSKNKSATPQVLQAQPVASKLSRNRAKIVTAQLAAAIAILSPKKHSPLPKTPIRLLKRNIPKLTPLPAKELAPKHSKTRTKLIQAQLAEKAAQHQLP
ncbi:hypothetical protein HOH87_06810 [bacterium]|jgi:hypothetical protein|nr:hypothetical protein [bacterium]